MCETATTTDDDDHDDGDDDNNNNINNNNNNNNNSNNNNKNNTNYAEDRAVGLSLDPETSFALLRLLVAACARTSSMILL